MATSLGFLGSGHIATALVRGITAANVVQLDKVIASATSVKSKSLEGMKVSTHPGLALV